MMRISKAQNRVEEEKKDEIYLINKKYFMAIQSNHHPSSTYIEMKSICSNEEAGGGKKI